MPLQGLLISASTLLNWHFRTLLNSETAVSVSAEGLSNECRQCVGEHPQNWSGSLHYNQNYRLKP